MLSQRSSALLVLLLFALLAACAGADRGPAETDAPPVREDINTGFLDPKADPQRWVDRFEVESREIFAQRDAIAAAVGLVPGKRIADVGAGTGLFVEPFAEAVGESGRVLAVDISPRLVQHMEERFAELDLGQVEVVRSEETSTTLAPGSVDVIFTCDTYHHFTHYEAMLASIHQALAPGGRLIIVDFERIPGVTRDWLLDHVRADKEQVTAEAEAAGFVLEEEVEIPGLMENYMLRFRKR